MSRRKNRKRARRAEQRNWTGEPGTDLVIARDLSDYDELLMAFEGLGGQSNTPAQKLCGGCREFVEDEHGGRGECLHPGSGIMSPWTDTPGCDFFARRR